MSEIEGAKIPKSLQGTDETFRDINPLICMVAHCSIDTRHFRDYPLTGRDANTPIDANDPTQTWASRPVPRYPAFLSKPRLTVSRLECILKRLHHQICRSSHASDFSINCSANADWIGCCRCFGSNGSKQSKTKGMFFQPGTMRCDLQKERHLEKLRLGLREGKAKSGLLK
jgi:hypothetical protein